MCSEPRDQGPSKTPWRGPSEPPQLSRQQSLLCWDQLVLSSWPSGSDTSCSLSPLWVLSAVFMASLRGRRRSAVSCRERAGTGAGREGEAALLVIKHCREPKQMTKPSPSCSGREAGASLNCRWPRLPSAPMPTWSCPQGAVSWELSPAGQLSPDDPPGGKPPGRGLRATQKTHQ